MLKKCEDENVSDLQQCTVFFQVVFATPGMLHAGQSLQIFKKWAGNEKNMVSVEDVRKRRMFFFKVSILKQLALLFLGDHAWVLCTRNNRSQDPKRAEETGDGRESNSKTVFNVTFTVTLSSITDILYRWDYLCSRQC